MFKINYLLFFLLIFFKSNSQEQTSDNNYLKSNQYEWINELNSIDPIDEKLDFIKLKIINDSIRQKNNRRYRLTLKHGESINEKLREEFESTDFKCQLLFILVVKGKYSIPLNINQSFDSKKVLKLIHPEDIDDIKISKDFEFTLIYGSEYCGVIFLNSSNRKLKRRIKNVL
tara:strand:+ start:169 stop:684 length:516 start_codon:yes stop_codon:yes gene_type:complete